MKKKISVIVVLLMIGVALTGLTACESEADKQARLLQEQRIKTVEALEAQGQDASIYKDAYGIETSPQESESVTDVSELRAYYLDELSKIATCMDSKEYREYIAAKNSSDRMVDYSIDDAHKQAETITGLSDENFAKLYPRKSVIDQKLKWGYSDYYEYIK